MSSFSSKLFVLVLVVVSVVGIVAAPPTEAAKKTGVSQLMQCYRQKPILRPRSNNRHVCVGEVQRLLSTPHTNNPSGSGYNPGPIDSIYGPQTKAAVRRFQQDCNRTMITPGQACANRKLIEDGIVGKQTWKALKAAYGTND